MPDTVPHAVTEPPAGSGGGRLYLRDDNKLLCYDIRKEALKPPQKEPLRIVLEAPTAGPLAEPRDRIDV